MRNRYITHSHISEKKFREVLRYFARDFTADQTAGLTHISRVTINRLYAQFRLRIAELLGGDGKLGGVTGTHKIKFLLHLKESEFRWNMRINHVNMYQELLKNFREKSL